MKTTIVYDYVPALGGGAERALLELAEHFKPNVDLYFGFVVDSSYSRKYIRNLHDKFGKEHIHLGPYVTWFRPIIFRIMNFLLPELLHSFNLQQYDLVISYTAFLAHSIIPPVHGKHILYMNTPARFLWNLSHAKSFLKQITSPFLITDVMRYRSQIYDIDAIERTKTIFAISQAVANRINTFYARKSHVLYPPAVSDTLLKTSYENSELKNELGEYFTHVSRVESYKNLDLLLDLAEKGQLKETVVIMGDGPYLKVLKARMKKSSKAKRQTVEIKALQIKVEKFDNIIFTNYIEEAKKMAVLAAASTSFSLNDEDFGITKIESLAVGTPVIGLRAGATAEIIKEGINGVLFAEATPEALRKAIDQHKTILYDKESIKNSAKPFTTAAFHTNLEKLLHA